MVRPKKSNEKQADSHPTYQMLDTSIAVQTSEGSYIVCGYEDLQERIDRYARDDNPQLELFRGAMRLLQEKLSVGMAEIAYKITLAHRERDQFVYEYGKEALL